ncbi:BA3454 family stress response protein [Bacillus sp. EB600]|nr:BA3454 family stress response protein [Bacillus sp. EB600]MCQ6280548.1 BA3454 family stress response protein [Bacillus sp. EB600]
MVQINVRVNYRGRDYLTNVITTNHTSEAEILRLASEQVRKQWNK